MIKKLTFQSQAEVYERIVRDRSGRHFRISFVIVPRDGILLGKIISCEQIFEFSPDKGQRSKVKGFRYYLPVRFALHNVKNKGLRIKASYVSPYFNKFEFLTEIKIRAPSR